MSGGVVSGGVQTESNKVDAHACLPKIKSRLLGESSLAQFVRFVFVGTSSNALYAIVFVALGTLGSFTANIAGVVSSTVLANELHRRHTFHAAGRVGWFQAQWEAGGLALIGLGLSTAALAALHVLFPGTTQVQQVIVVVTVSAAFGALRFLALRGWVFKSSLLSSGTEVPVSR